MLLGGQQGMPCQTLGGLEGQFQHTPNFNGIQPQHLIGPVLPTQVHTLHLVLRCILQGALLFIQQSSLQGALQLVAHGSPQGVPLSVLFHATGRGASDNMN